MDLQTLRRLLSNFLGAIENVIASGETIPDEMAMELAETLGGLFERIQQLEAPVVDQPDMIEAMPSSNVSGFNYDEKTGKLRVQFLGKYPNRQGPIYQYEGVPPSIFNLFRNGMVPARTKGKNRWSTWWIGKVPSIGASLYTLLRQGGFRYQRIS